MSEENKKEPYEKPETVSKINGKVWDFIADLGIGRKWIYVANVDEAEHLSIEITRMLFDVEYRWCLHDLYAVVKKLAADNDTLDNMEIISEIVQKNGDMEKSKAFIDMMNKTVDIIQKWLEIKQIRTKVGLK